YAVPAELPGGQYRGPAAAAARTVRHRGAAAAGAVRRRSAAADAWRALVALAQHPDLHRDVDRAPAVVDRTAAGGPVRTEHADADRADIPALADDRYRAGYPEHGGAISRPRARGPGLRGLCRRPSRQSRSGRARRFRIAATRRAPDRLLDRGRLLAPRDVAVAAQADRLRQGRAEAARRFPRRAAFQPRDPADRAEPCAP